MPGYGLLICRASCRKTLTAFVIRFDRIWDVIRWPTDIFCKSRAIGLQCFRSGRLPCQVLIAGGMTVGIPYTATPGSKLTSCFSGKFLSGTVHALLMNPEQDGLIRREALSLVGSGMRSISDLVRVHATGAAARCCCAGFRYPLVLIQGWPARGGACARHNEAPNPPWRTSAPRPHAAGAGLDADCRTA